MSSEAYAQKAERLLSLASTLHQNFYEDWLPPETVMDHAEAVKELVEVEAKYQSFSFSTGFLFVKKKIIVLCNLVVTNAGFLASSIPLTHPLHLRTTNQIVLSLLLC